MADFDFGLGGIKPLPAPKREKAEKVYDFNLDSVDELIEAMPDYAEKNFGGHDAKVTNVVAGMAAQLDGRISPAAKKLLSAKAKEAYEQDGFGGKVVPPANLNDIPDGGKPPRIEAEPSMLSTAGDFAINSLRAFGGGMTSTISDVVRAGAYATGTYAQDDSDGKTTFGEYLLGTADTIDFVDEPPPEFASSGTGQFFSAMGEVVGLVGTMVATAGTSTVAQVGAKAVTKGAAHLGSRTAAARIAAGTAGGATGRGTSKLFSVLPGAQAAAQGAVGEVEAYIEHEKEAGREVDYATANQLMLGGAAMGLLLESRLPRTLSNRLNEAQGSVMRRSAIIMRNQGKVSQIVARAAKAATEEAVAEGLQGIGSHVLAQALYEEDKDLYEELIDFKDGIAAQAKTGAGVGAALSMTFDGLGVLLAGRRLRRSRNSETYDGDDPDVRVSSSETTESMAALSADEIEREAIVTATNVPNYLRRPEHIETLRVARARLGRDDTLDKLAEDSGLGGKTNDALQTISEAMNGRVPSAKVMQVARKAVKNLPNSKQFLKALDSIYATPDVINSDAVGRTGMTHGDLIGVLADPESTFYSANGMGKRQAAHLARVIYSDNIADPIKVVEGIRKRSSGNTAKLLGQVQGQLEDATKEASVIYGAHDSGDVSYTGDQTSKEVAEAEAHYQKTVDPTDLDQVAGYVSELQKDKAAKNEAEGEAQFSTVYAAIESAAVAGLQSEEYFKEGLGGQVARASDAALGQHLYLNFSGGNEALRWMEERGLTRFVREGNPNASNAELVGVADALSEAFMKAARTGDYGDIEGGKWYKNYRVNSRESSTVTGSNSVQTPDTDLPDPIAQAVRDELGIIRKMFRNDLGVLDPHASAVTPQNIASNLMNAGIPDSGVREVLSQTGVNGARATQVIQAAKSRIASSRSEQSNADDIAQADQDVAKGSNKTRPQSPDDGIDYSSLTGVPKPEGNLFDKFRANLKQAGPTKAQSNALISSRVPADRPSKFKQWRYKIASSDGRLGAFGELGRVGADAYKHMAGEQHWRATRTKAHAEAMFAGVKEAITLDGHERYSDLPQDKRDQIYGSIIDPTQAPPDGYERIVSNARSEIDTRSQEIIGHLQSRHAFVRDKFGEGTPQEQDAFDEYMRYAEAIEDNKGSYLNRSYRVHDDFGSWTRQLEKTDMVDGVEQTKLEQIINNDSLWAEDADLSPEDRRAKANELLAKHKPNEKSRSVDFIEALDESKDILRGRKDVPDWARAVLGEKTDPIESYVGTISKMDSYMATMAITDKYMDAMFTAGLLKTDNADNDPNFVPLGGAAAPDGRFSGSMFKGFYADKALLESMDELGPPTINDTGIAMSNTLNGILKTNMTVGNMDTHIRNSFGSILAIAANGNMTAQGMAAAHTHARQIFAQGEGKVPDEHVEFLLREGIIQDSAAAADIFESFKNNDYGRMVEALGDKTGAHLGEAYGETVKQVLGKKSIDREIGTGKRTVAEGVADAAKYVGGGAAAIYRFPDGFMRTANFYAEYQKAIEAGIPEEKAKMRAAKRTRDTMPGSSEVPWLVKQLRSPTNGWSAMASWALINPFLTATVSSVQTTANRMKYARQDIASGTIEGRNSGIKALGSTALILGMLEEWANPDDEEGEDGVSQRIHTRNHWNAMPEWSRGIDGRVERIGENGEIIINTTHWSNSYSTITGVASILTAKDLTAEERLTQMARHVVNEFGGQSISVQTIVDMVGGAQKMRDDDGDALREASREALYKLAPKDMVDAIKYAQLDGSTDEGRTAILNERWKQLNSGRTIMRASDPFNNIGYAFRDKVRANDYRLKKLFKDAKKTPKTDEQLGQIWIDGEIENLEYMKSMVRQSESWRKATYNLNGQGHTYKPQDVYNWLRKGITMSKAQYRYLVRMHTQGKLDDVSVTSSLPNGEGMIFDREIVENSLDRVFEGKEYTPEDEARLRQRMENARDIIKRDIQSGALSSYARQRQ